MAAEAPKPAREPAVPASQAPTLGDYLQVSTVLGLFTAAVTFAVARSDEADHTAEAVLTPVVAMVALTGVTWLLMVVVRNAAVLRGLVSTKYYEAYSSHVPEEWVERPARAFNNLMQVPTLFYLVCVLMLVTDWRDDAQLGLAWLFVVTRLVHAVVYIGFNNVKWRFACWMFGCITLVFLWTRLALHS